MDGAGNAYVTGETLGQLPDHRGAFQTTLRRRLGDAFVTKLNPSGRRWSTPPTSAAAASMNWQRHRRGRHRQRLRDGRHGSTNFPTTAGAFQTTSGGSRDAFVTKLNPTGTALSTPPTSAAAVARTTGQRHRGGRRRQRLRDGRTHSTDFPTTAGAFQTTSGGATMPS